LHYLETKQQSAEILRLLLPLMARQEAAFHPLNYAIWYEHTAGINPALTRMLEEGLSAKISLTESDVRRLYAQYIAGRDAEVSERMQAKLRQLLDEAARSTAGASEQVGKFEETLEGQEQLLGASRDGEVVRRVICELLGGTRQMLAVTTALSTTLAACAHEIVTMSERLEQAQSEALLDPLTGLNNRRGFRRAVERLEGCDGGLVGASLLVADIDNFKTINDTHGHLLGDKVIHSVAHVLRSNIKGRDIPVRLGGDEFAVLLPDTALSGAAVLAEKIRARVAQGRIRRADGADYIGQVTVSVGIAAAAKDEALDALLQRADEALYAAKRAGRNRAHLAQAVTLPAQHSLAKDP
jgi:diguanylate cyclase